MRGALLTGVFLAGLLTAGCSSVQESLECPGEDCPASLKAVADGAAEVPGVTSVDRAWRFHNIDKGHSGGVDVHAEVSDERAARSIATDIAALYRDSDVAAVSRISVRVVPEPEASEPDTEEGTLGGGPTASADVPCAAEGCVDEVAAFEQEFADGALAGDATLGDVGWVADDYRPYTSIEVTAPDAAMDATELAAFRDDVLDVARSAGLTDLGQVKTVIHYRKRLEFDFTFDGGRSSS
ncbi:MAG: hypothetical protein JWN22_1481 [Nocardioides sp.]|nr:hypothetical protein [Nocardioides sp.]